MSNRFFVLAFVVIFISCSKVGPGEHGHLAFENNSSDTVYVENFFDDGHVYMDYHFGVSEEYCGIAPGSVNYETLSIYSSGMCYSYEYVFSKKKTYDKIYVFVVPFYPKESCPPKPLFSYRLVCYELTYEDLLSLDFHLYYPPNEKMKNVKMEPPYETFAPPSE